MADLVQTFIGYGMVLIAALYVVWKFMPSNLRTWLTLRIAASMGRRGVAAQRVIWLETKLSGGACGTCAACGSCGNGKQVIERAAPTAERNTSNNFGN